MGTGQGSFLESGEMRCVPESPWLGAGAGGQGAALPGAGGGCDGEVSSGPTPLPVFGMWGPNMCFPLDLIQGSVSPPSPTPKGTLHKGGEG